MEEKRIIWFYNFYYFFCRKKVEKAKVDNDDWAKDDLDDEMLPT